MSIKKNRPINRRVKAIIEKLHISQNEFAKRIGISSTLISQITTERNNFGIDILQKIVSIYPEFNYDWLVAGRGKMYYKEKELDISEEPDEKHKREIPEHLKAELGKQISEVAQGGTGYVTKKDFELFREEIMNLLRERIKKKAS